ncbi:hypothetical protein KQH40_00200 [bacterium]|nr:hypothetical protein [bacterium]
MRNLVGVRDQRTVRGAANAINEIIHHRAVTIQGIAIRAGENLNSNDLLASAEYLLPDFDLGIGLFTPEGSLISFIGDVNGWESLETTINEIIITGYPSYEDGPILSEPFPYKDQYYSLIYYQTDPQSPFAVGVFSVHNLATQTLTGSLTFDNKGAVILVDQNLNLLFQSGHLDLAENPETHPGVSEALSGDSGTTYFRAADGEHVVAYSPITVSNWGLIIEEPWASVASPLLRYSETGSLILLPIAIFSIFALWFGTKQIIQPISLFRGQAEDFSRGNYQAFKEDVGGISEIRDLHNTFFEMADEVEGTQKTLRRFLELVTTGQEEERKRLARELHDDTLQSLIALNQRVMMVKRRAESVGLEDSLSEIEAMIAQTMSELRRFTQALRPIYLEDLGLVTALDTLTKETSQSSNIQVDFRSVGDEKRLSDSVEIALFRISQEALSNILRHSEAKEAQVSISFTAEGVELMISDNGIGFVPPKNPGILANKGHFGLLGIHERAELIGATITIDSVIGRGTNLILQIQSDSNFI